MLAGLISSVIALFVNMESAYGHERWFIKGGTHAGERLPLDLTSWLVLAGVSVMVLVAPVADKMNLSRKLDIVSARMRRALPEQIEWRVLGGIVGAALVINSFMGVFLAPELALPGGGSAVFARIVQAAIGLLLFFRVTLSLAGILLIATLPLAAAYFSAGALADYVTEYASLGVAFFLVGIVEQPNWRFAVLDRMGLDRSRLENLALTVARAGIGLTFILLALHNKLANPDLALTFLDEYPLNFMPLLGFTGFSNSHFVFATGITEVAVGLLLAFGVATRFVAATVIALMLLTLGILGRSELVGHLPLIGAALLFLYRGAGPRRLSLPAWRKPAVFISR